MSVSRQTSSVSSLMQQGLEHFRHGQLAQAEDCLRRAVEQAPHDAELHHNLGAVLGSGGRPAEALIYFEKAAHLQPGFAAAHNSLGIALRRLGRHAEAIAAFRQCARLGPGNAEVHNNLGAALAEFGAVEESLAAFRTAISLVPNFAEAHNNLGLALFRLGRHSEAAAAFRQSVRLRPGNAETHSNLGAALIESGAVEESLAAFRTASALEPNFAEAHNNLGLALNRLGRHSEAAAAFRQFVRLRPDNARAHSNLGFALIESGAVEESLAVLRPAIALDPEYAEAHNNLGLALIESGAVEESLAVLRTAIALDPGFAEAHGNLGIALDRLGDLDGALASFAEAERLRPDHPDTRVNRALTLLKRGDYERGWPEYEWRWKQKGSNPRSFRQPRWDGSALEGRTILLHAEQGFGDTIQFVRFAPLVRARGGVVLVEAPAVLLPLLARCPGIDRLVTQGTPLPDFDVEAPLLSLPGLLGITLRTLPASIPYLSAEPERLAYWRSELKALSGLKIGIAWRGSPGYRGDRRRSLPLRCFEPLARLPGVCLVSLQKGAGAEELLTVPSEWNVRDLAPRLHDFMDTAAVVAQLDLVVCVDTAVGHLAGALGVPVWLALSFASDWRWGLAGESSPWYPRTRLFRQRRGGSWDDVLERMAEVLWDGAAPLSPMHSC